MYKVGDKVSVSGVVVDTDSIGNTRVAFDCGSTNSALWFSKHGMPDLSAQASYIISRDEVKHSLDFIDSKDGLTETKNAEKIELLFELVCQMSDKLNK